MKTSSAASSKTPSRPLFVDLIFAGAMLLCIVFVAAYIHRLFFVVAGAVAIIFSLLGAPILSPSFVVLMALIACVFKIGPLVVRRRLR